MARYAWIITKDTTFEEGDDPEYNAVGVSGPRSITDAQRARLEAGEGRVFWTGDEDSSRQVQGRILGEFDGLEPLDDFSQPNWGHTEIRYPGSKDYGNGAAL